MLMVVAARGDIFRLKGWIYQGVGRGDGMLVSQRCKHLRLKNGEVKMMILVVLWVRFCLGVDFSSGWLGPDFGHGCLLVMVIAPVFLVVVGTLLLVHRR